LVRAVVILLLDEEIVALKRVNGGRDVLLDERLVFIGVLDHSVPAHWSVVVDAQWEKGGLIDALRCDTRARDDKQYHL
jgi:hypothetical protein